MAELRRAEARDARTDRRVDDPGAGYLPPRHARDSDVDPWAAQDRDVGASAGAETDVDPWSAQGRDTDWSRSARAPESIYAPEPVRAPEPVYVPGAVAGAAPVGGPGPVRAPEPVRPAEPAWQAGPAQQDGQAWQTEQLQPEPTQERERVYPGPVPSAMAASAPALIPLIGGVWLLVSRLVYSYPAAGSGADGVVNGIIVGIAIALVALARMTTSNSSPLLGLVLIAFGGWMIAAPWVFGYAHFGGGGNRATWSDVITGGAVVLFGLATWVAGTMRQLGVAGRGGARAAASQ